jgi:hypothetical protein
MNRMQTAQKATFERVSKSIAFLHLKKFKAFHLMSIPRASLEDTQAHE